MADDNLANHMAREMGDAVLNDLHLIQAFHDGHTALAAALGAMTAALSFIRSACGDQATLTACEMMHAIARERREVVVPSGKVRQ